MTSVTQTRNVAPTFEEAKRYTKRYARSFYFASHVLPQEKRNAAYAVYAFCRLADNIIDDGREDLNASLASLRRELDGIYADHGAPGLASFQQTVKRYAVPKKYFLDLLRGMEMDIVRNRYETFEQLKDYCYCVASVVGLVMARIFGVSDEKALVHARDLGTAMQLTNILRDVKEDADRGRIYLPQQELHSFGITEDEVLSGTMSHRFRDFMIYQIDRARSYFGSGAEGFPYLPDDGSRFCVQLMSGTYSRILAKIEQQNYDVFLRRAVVPLWEKLVIATRVRLFPIPDGTMQ